MAKEHLFDDLVSAIHDSVITANQIAENQHIQLLEEYFDDKSNPVCIEVNLPSYDPKDPETPVYKPVLVPKLSLVPISSFKMKEIEVSFEVKFTRLMKRNEEDDTYEKNGAKGIFSFQNRSKKNEDELAKVTIKFEGCDPPEGILRINDQLVKLIP